MKLFSSTVTESDLYQLFIAVPIRILLAIFSVGLCLHPLIPELTIYALGALTLPAVLIRLLSGNSRLRSLFIGGDLFVWIFAGVILSDAMSDGFQFTDLAPLHIFIFIYILSNAFAIAPSVNHRYFALLFGSVATFFFSLIQPQLPAELFLGLGAKTTQSPFPDVLPYSLSGLLAHPEDFGFLLSMLVSVPLGIYIVNRRLSRGVRSTYALVILALLTGTFLTFQPTSWFVFTVPFVTIFFVTKKTPSMIVVILLVSSYYGFSSKISAGDWDKQISSQSRLTEEQRRTTLREHLQTFRNSPWVGVGFTNADTQPKKVAPNTYFQLLSSTGVVGFLGFMGFAIYLLFSSLRLWQDIPRTHQWHKSFVIAALGSQLAFHSSGLFVWSLGNPILVYPFALSAATISFLSARYSKGVVPDDYSV